MSLFEAYWSYSYADVIEQSEHKVSSLRRFASWIAFPRSKSKLAPAARALLVAGSLAAVIFVASAAPHLESEKRASPLAHSAHSPSPVLSLAKADDFPLDADFSVETASQTWERRLFAKAEPYDPDSMRFGSQKVQRSIVERVVKAAAATGSDPALLLSIADKESSFILKAKASTSSASGLFQFIDSTWMTAMKSFGWRHLQQEAQGSPAEGVKPVASISRSEILKLRNDPYLSAVLAAEILKTEGAKISGEIGRGLTAGETYLIHFLGPDDARRFMAKMDQDPQTPAAKLLPRPARANRSIFFASLNGRLKPKSLREVHDAFEAMMMARVDRFRDAEARVPDAVAAANAAGATAYTEDK
ncbi:MAG: transglycosylase SLT domain-containing protein [Methylocystis sp.]